jgi:hypothetical protein
MAEKIDKRFQKALRIYELPDGIVQDKTNPNLFLVRSETDPVLMYEITFNPVCDMDGKVVKMRGACNCVDYMYRSRTDIEHKCAHVLVYFVARSRKKPIKKVNVTEYVV